MSASFFLTACFRGFIGRAVAAVLLLLLGPAVRLAMGDGPLRIRKISFLIHPVCWDLALDKEGKVSASYAASVAKAQGKPQEQVVQEFMELLAWERKINEKQKEYIDRMKQDEVLVIFPIGARPAMKALENHGRRSLERRCIIVQSESPQENRKVDYQKLLPEAARLEVANDLIEAIQKNGLDPNFNLEVILYNRMIALEVQEEFRKRQLTFDPQTVETVAFGEGFAACAMTWKAMLPQYLKLANPIENDFELSVDGPVQLASAAFKGRVAVNDEVRLFLWQLKDGRPMALFSRPRARFSDRKLYVKLPFNARTWTVLDPSGKELPVKLSADGTARAPVYAALRRAGDIPTYIIARDLEFSAFRQALATPTIAHSE